MPIVADFISSEYGVVALDSVIHPLFTKNLEAVPDLLASTFSKRSELTKLYGRAIGKNSVTIIGFSGWLGSALVGILDWSDLKRLTLINSTTFKTFEWGHLVAEGFVEPDSNRHFEVDLVIDFAAVTRDNPKKLSLDEARSVNDKLHERGIRLIEDNICGRYVGFSSGASLEKPPRLDWYGETKLRFEQKFLDQARTTDRLLRIWSTSGSYCSKPRSFALTDFIVQAATRSAIKVSSDSPVFRRYAPIEETILWGLATSHPDPILDSGGYRVEMIELAERTGRILNPSAQIEFSRSRTRETYPYISGNGHHEAEMLKLGYEAMSLEEQICNSCVGLDPRDAKP